MLPKTNTTQTNEHIFVNCGQDPSRSSCLLNEQIRINIGLISDQLLCYRHTDASTLYTPLFTSVIKNICDRGGSKKIVFQ